MKNFRWLRGLMGAVLLLCLGLVQPALTRGDDGEGTTAVTAPRFHTVHAQNAAIGTNKSTSRFQYANFTNRLIVKYKDMSIARAQTLSSSRVQALSARAGVTLTHLRPMSGNGQVFRLPRRMSLDEAKAIADRVAADPGVEYAQPDRLLFPMMVPDDPQYANQWHYKSPDAPDYEIAGINLPAAWDITTGSSSLVIGVIDTGIVNHADLQGRTVPGYNFISDPDKAGNGVGRSADPSDLGDWVTNAESTDPTSPFYGCPAEDSSWHGTHVAGTIGAASNNGMGVAGINWNSKILPVRVLGKCGGYTSDIVDGMRWAAGLSVSGVPANPNPAKVINMSLGGGGSCDPAEQSAIDDVTNAGTTVVVAAGNNSDDAANYTPASCSGVITVAAVGRAGGMAFYSNYGQDVKIAAPGGEWAVAFDPNSILSTLNTGTTSPIASPDGDTYVFYQGTSMATPHVTGIVSLMLSVNPALTPPIIAQLLQTTARPFPVGTASYGGDCDTSLCGAGMVDAYQAVQAVSSNAPLISAAPGALTFRLLPGDNSNPPGQTIAITNPGGGTLNWSVSTDPTATWLQVSPTSGVNSGTVTVSVDASHLTTAATYTAAITISDNGAANSPVVIPVTAGRYLTLHANLFSAVSDHAAATVNGKLYVIGGWGGGPMVQIFDPATDSWSLGTPKPTQTVNAAAAVINGKIYVPGGGNPMTNAVLDALEIYDPATDQWTTGASLPQPLEASGVAAVNGKLYVLGGQDDTYSYQSTLVYDPNTDSWSSLADMGTYRSWSAAAVDNGKIYLVGGLDGAGTYTNSVLVYDPTLDSWSNAGVLNVARSTPAVADGNGKLYIFGGWDGTQERDDVEAFDTATGVSSVEPFVMNQARSDLAAVTANGSIYVPGGWNGSGDSSINESYDLPCSYSIDPTSASFEGSGGMGSVAVTTTYGRCGWSAESNASWITVTSAPTSTGDGSVNFSVDANTGATRSGTITIAGQTFTVSQSVATYTVTYNGNGNTGGAAPVDGNAYLSGDTVTVLGDTGSMTKTGYSFAGWNTAGDGSGTSYTPAALFTINSNVTFYAMWTINTYTATFDSNGGSTVTSQTVAYNGTATAPTAPTKTGYTFAGWYADSGLTTAFSFSTAITADITLYAKWTLLTTYTVTYNGNGSTGGSAPVDGNAYLSGAVVTVLGNTGSLTKTDYTFGGWNTAANGSGTTYAGGSTFTISSNVTLYAVWTINTYTVTFNSNGGSTVTSQTVVYNSTATAPTAPTKTGYTFAGWYSDSGLTAAFDFSSPITADITLYAKWTASACTLTLSPTSVNMLASGGTGTFGVTATGSGCSSWTAISNNSWITTGAVNIVNNVVIQSYSVTVNAQAARIGTISIANQTFTVNQAAAAFTVTFNGNGGSAVSSQTVAYNGTATAPTAPTKTGYTFAGWYADSGLTTAFSFSTAITADLTLYAKWTLLTTYTVTYNGNGSTGGSAPVDGNAYLSGAVVTVLGNTGSLTKTGYTFGGWNTAANGSGTTYAGESTFTISSNVTLYAVWTINTYTVSFNSNGGSAVSSQSVAYNTTATAPTTPTKAGYGFDGWYSDSGLTTVFSFSTAITADITLYAKWTATSCTYSINPVNTSTLASGGTGSVGITTGNGCGWTAVSNDTWITVTGGSSGTGNGTTSYSVAANTGAARTGTITIAGQTFTVNQAMQTTAPDGDLDNDGVVTAADALHALRIEAGLISATAADLAHGDVAPLVNGRPQPDGKIDIGDVVVILRKAIGLVNW